MTKEYGERGNEFNLAVLFQSGPLCNDINYNTDYYTHTFVDVKDVKVILLSLKWATFFSKIVTCSFHLSQPTLHFPANVV